MTASTYKYIDNLSTQVTQISKDSIISQSIHNDKHTKVILFAFAAGQELSEHTTPFAATLQFIQGKADITLGMDSQTAQPGTWVQMPPNLPHSIIAKTEVLMLLTMLKPNDTKNQ